MAKQPARKQSCPAADHTACSLKKGFSGLPSFDHAEIINESLGIKPKKPPIKLGIKLGIKSHKKFLTY
jgi:hypothetical protein